MQLRRRIVEPVVLCGLLAQALLGPFAMGLTPALAASRGTPGAAGTPPTSTGAVVSATAAATSTAPVTATTAVTATALPQTITAATPGLTTTAPATPSALAMPPSASLTVSASTTPTATVTVSATAAPTATPALSGPATSVAPAGRAALLSAPLAFEANGGQTDGRVRYLARGRGYTLFLTDDGATLVTVRTPALASHDPATPLTATPALSATAVALQLRYVGASAAPQVAAEDRLAGVVNYYTGRAPGDRHSGLATYGRVAYHALYPGIDLVYYGRQGTLEWDWEVAPGGDPGAIAFTVAGAQGLSLAADGTLLLHTATGDVAQRAPVAYQEIAGQRHTVDVRYLLSGDRVGLAVGAYDPTHALTIDPVLSYSTLLGGSGADQGNTIAVDAAGNAYVSGYTTSSTFPTLNAVQPTYGGGLLGDAFAAKLNAAGSALVYSTFLGGSGQDASTGLALDTHGDAYVTGYTASSNYPTTAGAYDPTSNGGTDAFVTELNADDSARVYSTFLGGAGTDAAYALAVDAGGNAYVTGETASTLTFPQINAVQTGYGGGDYDAFVSKLGAGGSALVYSTFLGGNGHDQGNGIAVDAAGNATVVGQTQSTTFLTTTNALQPSCADTGCTLGDAFVTTLGAGGGALLSSSYLGGNGTDGAQAVAVDTGGNIYATGVTSSTNFLTTAGAYDSGADGGNDAFVTRIALPSSGDVPWHPHHTVRLSDTLSASIDLADGHVDVSADDLSIPGRGLSLTLRHTWDSTAAAAGLDTVAGQGWRTTLTPRLTGVVTQTMVFTDDSGAAWPFLYLGSPSDTSPYTTYRTPPGLPWQLTTSSAAYTLTNILSGETLSFDTLGRLSADADSYGNQNSLSYDLYSVPKSIANSGGRTLKLSDQNGKIADVQGPLWQSTDGAEGQHVAYAYNGSGQLTRLTWGAGTTDALTATFGYSGTQLISVTTPYTQSPHTWTIGYDGQGRVSTLTSPISGTAGQTGYTPAYTTALSYTAGQTQLVDGLGASGALTTTYTLDAAGEAITTTDALSHSTTSSYDADHDVTSSTDANTHTTTTYYQYVGPNGSTGLITETVAPAIAAYVPGNGTLTPVQTLHDYNATNDLTETVSPNGGLTLYGYDGRHSVITTTEQTIPTDCPSGCVSWRGSVNQLDQYGEVTGTVDGRGVTVSSSGAATLAPSAPSYTQRMAYDTAGDQINVSTPPITTTLNGITQTVPVTTAYGYDADGNQISVTSPNGTRAGTAPRVAAGYTAGYSYDHLGRQVQTVLPGVGLAAPASGSGTINTVAGSGTGGFGGDGGPATQAKLFYPYGVAEDGAGNLYIVDQGNHRLREVFARSGLIATLAGTGIAGPAGDGGPAVQAQLSSPYDVALDAQGNLYIADSGNNKVREIVASSGLITTVVGTGTACATATAPCGDGGPASAAQLNSPKGVALDAQGNLYLSDSTDNRIRLVNAQSGIITTVAGSGTACSPSTGTCGDGGTATTAQLNAPRGIGLDAQDNLYIADTNDNRVREVVAGTGVILTVVGTGAQCAAPTNSCGDGGAAGSAQFYVPRAVAADEGGNLYIADTGDNRVREVISPTNVITTVAGTGAACSPSTAPCGDGGPATAAQLNEPIGLAVDGANNVFIGDYNTHRVRKVQGSGLRPAQSTAYDGEGNVVQQVDGAGDVTADSYDPLGRLVAETNPVSGTAVYTYNATEQTAVQDPLGYLNRMSYDPAGRLTQTTDPISGTQQFAYDPVGNTTVISSGDGVVVTQTEAISYDALDEPTTDTVSAPVAPSEPPSTTLTAYDLDGNVAQRDQPQPPGC